MTSTIALVLLAAGLAAGCASAAPEGPVDPRTRIPPGVAPEWLHFTDSVVAAGDLAPEFDLPTPDGASRVALSSLRGRPLVLVFGSHT